MAMAIVDLFEVVEVEEQGGERPPGSAGVLDLLLEPGHQHAAVADAGQWIGQHQRLELGRAPLAG